jgi:hypothetical protein
MAAAAAGNVPLVEALLARGADREAVDHYGWNALHWSMREAFREEKFARGPFAALYELLAPASIDVRTGERLVRIDRHLTEYFIFQTLWVLFKSRFTHQLRRDEGAFQAQAIIDAWQHLPANVVRPERNKRQHLTQVLARNEIDRDYAYNRALFKRVRMGCYQFNPQLAVRRRQSDEDLWLPIFLALNLPLINEFARWNEWSWAGNMSESIKRYLALAGLPAPPMPIVLERIQARIRAAEEAQQARFAAESAARDQQLRQKAGQREPIFAQDQLARIRQRLLDEQRKKGR